MINLLLVSVLTTVLPVYGSSPLLAVSDEYVVSNVQLDFNNAYATCKRYGYSLATERSAEETEKINAAIIAAGHNFTWHYIGGYYQQGDDLFAPKWLWYETGEDMEYTNWKGTPPISQYFCLAKSPMTIPYLTQNETTSGKWVGSICNFIRYFVCQTGISDG